MPSRSPRVCGKPGCGKVSAGRYCDVHTREVQAYDRERPSRSKRGYGRRWIRYRRLFLAQHPICACGCGRLATEIDHIVPVDGPDDPRFWDPKNHQALTHEDHSRKTMGELRSAQTDG